MNAQRLRTPVLALALAIGASGLALMWAPRFQSGNDYAQDCGDGSMRLRRIELVFGLSRKEREDVSEAEWSDFLAREVTPRFPDGLTVLAANGQWRNAAGTIVREPARLLLVWVAAAPDLDRRIEQIRAAWKREQQQASVLRADSADCISF